MHTLTHTRVYSSRDSHFRGQNDLFTAKLVSGSGCTGGLTKLQARHNFNTIVIFALQCVYMDMVVSLT